MLKSSLLLLLAFFALVNPVGLPAASQGAADRIEIIDQAGRAVSQITDGDLIRLRLVLAEKASQETEVSFQLTSPETAVASCTVRLGESQCESASFRSLGWFWGENAAAQPERTILASSSLFAAPIITSLQVAPRPVVMVHGFVSNWQAWSQYLGPDGYLASIGLAGYAVGDGQVEGVMNTGSLTNPAGRTHTIAQNAAILGEYIAQVKKKTGAQQVDLIGHSMGGMISRYYIDRVMQERDIAQLIMLGTPSSGTDCAVLPSALGFYLPTVLEIRTSYMSGIFNRQITHRRGVPFSAVAGTLIQNSIGSPCAEVPNDSVVSVQSVSSIHLVYSEIPLLHTELNTSEEVFQNSVSPLLQKLPGEFRDEPDPQPEQGASPALQFTRVYSGHIPANDLQTLVISIEPGLTVANFALFDPSLSLSVTVRGASGNEITLDPVKNGLIVVDDPETLVQLGYGFENPKPGAWQVVLQATERTPAGGADFALTAHFVGGAEIEATTSSLLPQVNEPVRLAASLALNGQPLAVEQAQALIRSPQGEVETMQLTVQGSTVEGTWRPDQAGLYGIDLQAVGKAPDGSTIERTAFLTVEAQPSQDQARTRLILSAIALGFLCLTLIAAGLLFLFLLRRRSQTRAKPR
jgi:pimeloyl-ACP methyl ester carboxylesterase